MTSENDINQIGKQLASLSFDIDKDPSGPGIKMRNYGILGTKMTMFGEVDYQMIMKKYKATFDLAKYDVFFAG
jgi:hypothetical protein